MVFNVVSRVPLFLLGTSALKVRTDEEVRNLRGNLLAVGGIQQSVVHHAGPEESLSDGANHAELQPTNQNQDDAAVSERVDDGERSEGESAGLVGIRRDPSVVDLLRVSISGGLGGSADDHDLGGPSSSGGLGGALGGLPPSGGLGGFWRCTGLAGLPSYVEIGGPPPLSGGLGGMPFRPPGGFGGPPGGFGGPPGGYGGPPGGYGGPPAVRLGGNRKSSRAWGALKHACKNPAVIASLRMSADHYRQIDEQQAQG